MNSNTHELKILPQWFTDVLTGKKNFEIRRNDRDFKVGDYLLLREYEPAIAKYSGREITKRIQYIYHGDGNYGLSEEFCILGLEERPQGEWVFSGVEHTADNPIDSDSYYCSVCKRSISTTLTRPSDLFPFCHCGADMRGEEK